LLPGERERAGAVAVAASRGSFGSTLTPRILDAALLGRLGAPFSSCSKMSVSWSPRNTDRMAGGASFAPEPVIVARVRNRRAQQPCHLSTPRSTAAQNTRNCMLSCGVSPGPSRLLPNSSDSDQLLCLPEPLTPANGFSCSRQARPYFGATRCSVSIVIN
jgi:hypothetical protein